MKTKVPTPAPDAGRMVRLRNSIILSGPPAKFVHFNVPTPLSEIPERLRHLIIDESAEPELSAPPDSRFFLNTPYAVGADGRLRRHVEGQAAQLEAEAAEDDAIAEQLNRPPSPEIAAAIEDARQNYVADINRQLAEAKLAAAKGDLEQATLEAEQQNRNGEEFEDAQIYDPDIGPPRLTAAEYMQQQQERNGSETAAEGKSMTTPTKPKSMTTPTKPKMRVRFVNRNGTWLRTKRLKRFHVGEKVYVKDSAGAFKVAGKVNKAGRVPAVFVEESK